MSRVHVRVYVIAVLAAIAAGLGYYTSIHPAPPETESMEALSPASADPSPERIRSMVDTVAQLLGAPKKFIAKKKNSVDSGRVVPESSIGVPAVFDELHLITALTDSVRAFGYTVAAVKNVKEKTTTIQLMDRDHTCIYRCILYRRELPH
jgi:hypothetical protein